MEGKGREGYGVNEMGLGGQPGGQESVVHCNGRRQLLAPWAGSLLLASAGLGSLPGVTEPVLGPWAHLSLPLGTQAGRRDRHGWSLAKDVVLVAAMVSRQCSSKGGRVQNRCESRLSIQEYLPALPTAHPSLASVQLCGVSFPSRRHRPFSSSL